MSNSLAIATVTEVLGQVVHAAAENMLGKTVVRYTGRPEEPGALADPSVYLYLYQVTINGALCITICQPGSVTVVCNGNRR